MANHEADLQNADVTSSMGEGSEQQEGVVQDQGDTGHHNKRGKCDADPKEGQMSAELNACELPVQNGVGGVKESYQGPHRWRERLRPVRRSDGRRLTGIRDSDGSANVERSESFDRPWKDGRKLNRDDRIDDNKIRERLKSMPGWKKDWTSRKHNGPMVVKHAPNSGNAPTANSQAASSNIPVRLHKRRHLSPHAESAFTRNVVNNPVSYSGSRRKLSPHNSFQFRQPGLSAGFYSGRRTPSPNTLHDPSTQSELTNKRIAKVLRARLYLLQQMGPNSFMIGGDSPEHKYKVIIGPQSCSCGRGPHCAHLLFVMLRVFQVSETDSCLWAKTLKNFEVEALFGMYHNKRSLRLAARHQQKKTKESLPETHDSNSDEPTTPTEGDTGSSKDEEDTCPICLLEMLEGESLLKCENGCQNRLHHHCITIWFEECRRQGETLNCPLCRAEWKGTSNDNNNTTETIENGEPLIAPPNTRASSPTPEPHEDTRLPHAEPIPQEYMSTAEPWIQVLGEELVACLFSRNWSIRETALRHLSREVVATLLRGMGEGRSGVMVSPVRQSATHQMLNTCCSILAFMCADPVYKVFVACLRTLRTMMSYTPCRGVQQRQRLQALLKPIIDTIVLKCTDGNRRTSQLSISTIVELAKGQAGELAVGREIVNPGIHGLGGLKFVIQCVTEAYLPDSIQWQWLLGRMCILERLFEEFSEQFVFQGVALDEDDDDADLDVSMQMDPGRPSGYHFIIAVSQFTIKAVGYSHTRVAKLARRLFLVAAHYAAHDPSATTELETMLANTEARLAPAMRRKFRKIVQDNRVSHAAEELDFPSDLSESDSICVSVPSPSISPVSTPRCNSPESVKLVNVPQEDGQSEASCSGNVAPAVPPNTPRHVRRARPEPEGSSDIVDSLNTSDRSEPREDAHEEGRSEVISAETGAHTLTTPLVQSVINISAEDVIGLAQMEAVVDIAEDITASHSTAEEVYSPPSPPQSLHIKPSSPGEELPWQGEVTPASTPRSRTSSLRDSLSTDGVVSLCDAETINPSESSHRQAPVCRCSAGLSPSVVTTTKLRRSVSDTQTPTGSRKRDGAVAPEGNPHPKPRYSRSVMLTEDLDFRFSPPPSDQPVCFKTEVATPSPKHSPSTTADQASSDPECKCKEEVELEEALALAKALDVSSKQDPTPVVPGLTPTDREEVITIRIQPEGKDQGDGLTSDLDNPGTSREEPKLYFENIHWVKGLLLGTGAYSTCYQARDVQTGVIMAVKQISFCRNSPSEQEKVIEAITEEIHMMSRLNHPNIVRILGATKQGCHFNMFVEWMAGGSIAFLLDQYGAFSEPVIISYIQQVLRGLAYLHDNHILHRDLKGANLLADSTGQRLRIGDFGAAARLASRSTGAGEFQGQLLGTIAFMAPEVLRGENYGRSCDVWSVGCVMIEMATRKPPWNATDVTNHLKLIFKIATCDQPPPIPPNMSPPVKDVMLRCLELNRTERPSAKELLLHPLFTQYQAPR